MGYALDILENKEKFDRPFIAEMYNPVLFGCFGFGAPVFMNFMARRPLLSGIQRHIVGGIACVFIGLYVNKKRDEYYAEKDAVLRHYVELHPDDFPDPERKKYKDVFKNWLPIR